MINRLLETQLIARIDYKKALIVLGPRQVGKTTLVRKIASSLDVHFLYVNGDDPFIQLSWNNASYAFISQFIGSAKVVVIDEAQRIENIGVAIKMIVDAQKNVQVIVSGSSALELSRSIQEPLTGRKWEFHLYPLSWKEVSDHYTFANSLSKLESFLVKGMYPEVITNPDDSQALLLNLAGSYLYKDVLELGGIRKLEILIKLLQALAWQVGSEVSYNELAQTVGADKITVSAYIDLLEKAFVIFRLLPFARNLRNEINTSRKIYFYDNGIRNTLINNYAPLSQRNDVGALWENFVISERKKYLAYAGSHASVYFWRNVRQAEIDYLEEQDGILNAFEIKWNPVAKVRFPKAFVDAYKPEESRVVHRENFWQYL